MSDTVKEIIQEELDRQGKNQKWLAQEIGVSEAKMSNMLQRTIRNLKMKDIEKLSRALSMPIEALLKEYINSEEK